MIAFGISRRPKYKKYLPPAWFTAASFALAADLFTPQILDWYWGNLIAGNHYLAQSAELTGIYGLTFLYFAVDYAIFYRLLSARYFFSRIFHHHTGLHFKPVLFHGRALKRIHTHLRIWPALSLFAGALIFGYFRYGYFLNYQKTLPAVRALILQPNTPLERPGGVKVLSGEFVQNIIEKTIPEMIEEASKKSDRKIDFIAIPESAVPYLTTDNTALTRRAGIYSEDFFNMASSSANKLGSNVFLNEITVEGIREGNTIYPAFYNSSAVFSPEGERKASYHKRILVAFGEYVPGFDLLEKAGLSFLIPAPIRYSGYQKGKSSNMLPFETSQTNRKGDAENSSGFIPLICYEVLFPEHVREFFNNNQNPAFMANLTQDGWYGDTSQSYQHFEAARIRSIEFRRAMIRATNSGTSGFVDLAGNYALPSVGPQFTPLYVPSMQIWDVPVDRSGYLTIYAMYGNSWTLIIFFLFSAHTAFHYFRIKRKNQ